MQPFGIQKVENICTVESLIYCQDKNKINKITGTFIKTIGAAR
jgi:hypothetical protein